MSIFALLIAVLVPAFFIWKALESWTGSSGKMATPKTQPTEQDLSIKDPDIHEGRVGSSSDHYASNDRPNGPIRVEVIGDELEGLDDEDYNKESDDHLAQIDDMEVSWRNRRSIDATELGIEYPSAIDYSGYDTPTCQRKGVVINFPDVANAVQERGSNARKKDYLRVVGQESLPAIVPFDVEAIGRRVYRSLLLLKGGSPTIPLQSTGSTRVPRYQSV